MSNELAATLEQAIEEESLATEVESVEGRACTSDLNDGIEYRINGDFIEIRPIIETIAEEPYIIEEFNVAFDSEEPHVNVFVVAEEDAAQTSLSTDAWL